MKSGEKKVALLTIAEHIEMELLPLKGPCMVILTQAEEQEQEQSFCQKSMQKHLEHPLVPDCEEEPTPEVQTQPRLQTKPSSEPPARTVSGHRTHMLQLAARVDIEMEIFPPLRVMESELVELKSDDPSVLIPPSTNKRSRLRWKRHSLQKTGLVVKDVFCLPRGHYVAHLDRHVVPQGKEQEALSAMGLTARITIDCSWSASQMSGRLVMLFQSRFVKQSGQKFSFTYLQCVQGSRVLFVPDAPAEGWTGEHVLRISGHGPLYIYSHLDCPQFPLDLETILRLFRQENVDKEAETNIVVTRRNLLRSAVTVVRRPCFCFRNTPVVSFSEDEAGSQEGPLGEFFRLTLLELQKSPIFEGHPGRLFITYDLTALGDRKYYEAGILIGWSLTHGGPGPRCLHPALYQLMCGSSPSSEDLMCTDIVDAEVQVRLQQLHSCTDVKLLSPSLCHWVSSSGIPGISSAHPDEIPAICNQLAERHIYHRVASMISQFKEGLNSCGGLWDTIQANWELFVPVMTNVRQQPLTLEEFRQLFTVCYSRSDSHCQLRAEEEVTVGHWETVLGLISGDQAGFSFEDLLAFITGADHLHPLGFPRLIALRFYSQDASMSSICLPHTSTCALELFLPRGTAGAAELSALLNRAVHEAMGFTRFQSEEHGKDGCS